MLVVRRMKKTKRRRKSKRDIRRMLMEMAFIVILSWWFFREEVVSDLKVEYEKLGRAKIRKIITRTQPLLLNGCHHNYNSLSSCDITDFRHFFAIIPLIHQLLNASGSPMFNLENSRTCLLE